MSRDELKLGLNLNSYIMIGSFLISFSASIGSYYKALGDIRQEIQTAMYAQQDKQRDEYSKAFATKEEARFYKELLLELKSDVKEIKEDIKKK